jgi:hypothetical protein
MLRTHILSTPIYEKLSCELDGKLVTLSEQISEIYSKDSRRAQSEMQTAKLRLMAAQKNSLEEAVREGIDFAANGGRNGRRDRFAVG